MNWLIRNHNKKSQKKGEIVRPNITSKAIATMPGNPAPCRVLKWIE